MSTDTVAFKQHDNGVSDIILQRPEKHNALNPLMISTLIQYLTDCENSDTIKVVRLRAQGTHFCAGADLNWMKESIDYTLDQNIEDAKLLSQLFYKLYHLPQPTIAMVQGACVGGGIGLVSCCDIAIASDNANFRFSEVSIGLTPATISPYVIRKIGETQARRFFLTAENINANKAQVIGLVHEAVPNATLAASTTSLCKQLLQNSADAMRTCKQLIADVSQHPINQALSDKTAHNIASMRTSAAGQQGMRAFLEKCKK